MVREVTYYENEYTGRAYKSYHTAVQKEKEYRLELERVESRRYAEELAVEYGFSDFYALAKYLGTNASLIRNLEVRMRVEILQRKFSSFSLQDVKDNLKPLVDMALSEIGGIEVTVEIYLDDVKVSSSGVKKAEFDESKVVLEGFDPTLHYLGVVDKSDRLYSYRYYSYPAKVVSKEAVVALLNKYDVKSCSAYISAIESELRDNMNDAEIYYVLESAGVDNWDGYDYARRLAEDDNQDWFALSSEERLSYLKSAGVDNWAFYDDVFGGYFSYSDLSIDEQFRFFQSLEGYLAQYWDNYVAFKKELLLS